MPSMRALSFTAVAGLAISCAADASVDSEFHATAKRQDEFFEVTGCHPHGTTLFCIHDGEEWQVTSDIDTASAPSSFSGCHSHSGTEMLVFCENILQ